MYKKRLGAYKITYILHRDFNIDISVGRTYRLLKTLNLPTLSTKKPTYSHYSDNINYQNHLNQHFNQNSPNLVWVSDITYIKVCNKWVYLCIIIDLFSRKPIAWATSNKPDSNLTVKTLHIALKNRNYPKGLMFHSDRGSQYTSFSFRNELDKYNITQSFSKKGYPYDNAVCECFFKYLKLEETNRNTYKTIIELNLALYKYINLFYCDKRPHTTLNMLTPNEYEHNYYNYINKQYQ